MLIDEKSVWNPDFPEACNEIQFGRIITNIIERSVSIFFAVFVTGINLSTVKKEKKRGDFIIIDYKCQYQNSVVASDFYLNTFDKVLTNKRIGFWYLMHIELSLKVNPLFFKC